MEQAAIHNPHTTEEASDFEAFRHRNRFRVNRLLNRVLWICILAGPAIALGIMGGVFRQTTYSTCVVISLVMAAVAGGNYLVLKRLSYSFVPGVLALVAMELLLCFMSASHVSIRLTWFLVPLLSLMFCESRVYIGVSILNYVVMGIGTWLEAAHYAEIRLDFASPAASFINIFAGCTIEALIMFAAGFALGSLTGKYYRKMVAEYASTQDAVAQAQEQMAILESMAEIYDYVNLIGFNESTEMSLRGERFQKLVIGES